MATLHDEFTQADYGWRPDRSPERVERGRPVAVLAGIVQAVDERVSEYGPYPSLTFALTTSRR